MSIRRKREGRCVCGGGVDSTEQSELWCVRKNLKRIPELALGIPECGKKWSVYSTHVFFSWTWARRWSGAGCWPMLTSVATAVNQCLFGSAVNPTSHISPWICFCSRIPTSMSRRWKKKPGIPAGRYTPTWVTPSGVWERDAQQPWLIHRVGLFHVGKGRSRDSTVLTAVDERPTLCVVWSRTLATENNIIQQGLSTFESKAIARLPGP